MVGGCWRLGVGGWELVGWFVTTTGRMVLVEVEWVIY